MGLIVSVYRAADLPDCTNNGVSCLHNNLCITNVKVRINRT